MSQRSTVAWGIAASVAIGLASAQFYLMHRLHEVAEELKSIKTERAKAAPSNQSADLAVKMLWSAIDDLGKSHNQLVEAHKLLQREVASDRVAASSNADRAEAAAARANAKALEPCIIHGIC